MCRSRAFLFWCAGPTSCSYPGRGFESHRGPLFCLRACRSYAMSCCPISWCPVPVCRLQGLFPRSQPQLDGSCFPVLIYSSNLLIIPTWARDPLWAPFFWAPGFILFVFISVSDRIYGIFLLCSTFLAWTSHPTSAPPPRDAIWGAHRPNYVHGQFGGAFFAPQVPPAPRCTPVVISTKLASRLSLAPCCAGQPSFGHIHKRRPGGPYSCWTPSAGGQAKQK
jgi:hypothetical protein